MIKRMIIMLFLVGLVLGGVYGFQVLKSDLIAKALSEYAAAPQTVSAVTATKQQWTPELKGVGTLRAGAGVDVTTEIPGIVDEITFESGHDVAAGTVLLHLRMNDSLSRLKQLQALATLAELTYQRDVRQLRDKAVSQATVDSDLANLRSARAQVDAQQALVDQKTIRAPFAGRLGIRQVDTGQYLNPGAPIVTLQALDPMLIDFSVPQQQIAKVKVGEVLTVRLDAFPGKAFSGRVIAINAKIDVGTRNVQVRAQVANQDRLLLPGMFARLDLWTGAPEPIITLPQTAITFNPFGSTVFVIEEHGKDKDGKPQLTVHQTIVKTGDTRGDQVAVVSGLNEGQRVVSSGQLKLRNGTVVTIDNSVQPSDSADPKLPVE